MFPILPIAFGAAIIGGVAFLFWYEQLSESEKAKVDELSAEVARELFRKTIEQLTFWERQQVYRETRRRF
jgi:hypothetical protein